MDAAPTSFARLYRSTVAEVYAYVASLVGERAAAEDVTAQAFERALSKRGRFDARRGSERAWIFGIARNAALDELRRRKRTAALVGDVPADPGAATTADDPDAAARRATVRVALGALAPRERELVALKFHGGLSNAEIAELVGTSESNVGTRMHRAITKLREACHVAV